MRHQMPMGWLATVDEVANAACFLASGHASCITGERLVVDGAWSINAIRDTPERLGARGG
jgi:enoyl-[acyl-carrier-protein] reductase (NADH)